VIAIRVLQPLLRRRGDGAEGGGGTSLQITVNNSLTCMQGLGGAASLLAVELFHTVSPAGHSSRLSLTVVAGASTGSQSAPLLITATFFPNRCDRDLQFLGSFGTYDLSCCHYSCCYLVSLVILSGSANWYILVTLLDRGLHDIWSTFF